MSIPFGAGLVPRRSLAEPVLPSDSSASYLDFIRVSASGGSLTGGRPGEVGSLSNIHLLSSEVAQNQQKTVDRRRGKRHGWPAEQASPVAHIFIRQVPLPSVDSRHAWGQRRGEATRRACRADIPCSAHLYSSRYLCHQCWHGCRN